MNIGRENETVEFKSSIAQLDKGVLSMTAMLNRSNRGTVFFGVDDNGDIIGIDVGDSTFEKIRGAFRQFVQPRVIIDIRELVSEDGKKYLSVSSSGFEIPYSFDGRYYIRQASSNESASPEMVAKMVLSRGYDSMRELESYVNDLSFHTLSDMMISRGLHPRQEMSFYSSIGLVNKNGKFNTNAYVLSDKNGLIMQIVEFQGQTRTSFSKRTDFGGQCMLMSMRNILDAVRSKNETIVDTTSGVREDKPLFDFECFREAWFNACLHNSWRTGVPPSVSIFDDRIEIQSTGSIPYGLPMEDFFEGRSSPVNESLFSIATMLGFTEHTGRGIPTIVERYGREAIRIGTDSVTVTIPFAFKPSFVISRELTELENTEFTVREEAVIDYIGKNDTAKISDISEHIGLNQSAVKRVLQSLKDKGVLFNNGTNRNSIWVLRI